MSYIYKLLLAVTVVYCYSTLAFADITVNVLAVNGTESEQKKEISTVLPKELSAEDILDTDGLELNYDVNTQSYYVFGEVTLGPKETKTYRVRIRDLWKIDPDVVSEIEEQIENSMNRIKDTKYYETGLIRKENLLQRLDYIIDEQKKFADNVEARINRHRVYSEEVEEIRSNALSVHFWRTKPPDPTKDNVLTFIIDAENTSDKEKNVEHKHYLPAEVKPEHIVESQEFEYRYDPIKKQPFLVKEEALEGNQKKRYAISVLDVWHVPEKDMEDLRDRARKAYKLLENTIYADSAGYLVASIKKNLDKIEASQAVNKAINEHISAFRSNTRLYKLAEKDVEALEDLLEAVREELERSKVKNVLKKVQELKSVKEIAEAVFKKPELNLFWKVVIGICTFVGLYTIIHFTIWGRRSSAIKKEDLENKDPETKE